MVTLGNTAFLIVNIFVIALLLFCMAFGWHQGGKRTVLDSFKILFHLTATIVLTIFLTKRYSWFGYESFYAYLNSKMSSAEPVLSPVEADKYRFVRSGVIWFFIALIGIDLIIRIAVRTYRKKHKKEKKTVSKSDRLAGEIIGGLLVMFWVIILSPLAVSLEKTEVFSNGSDLINKTVVTIPVNYIAKPAAKLIMPDSPVSRVWDEGIGAVAEGFNDADKWIGENRNDVKVIIDLTGIFYPSDSQ